MAGNNKYKFTYLNIAKKLYILLLLIIGGGIILHAPITVMLGSYLTGYSLLIKAWKEILMLLAGFLVIYILYKSKQFKLLKSPLILLILSYALLHFMLVLLLGGGVGSVLAGLVIDLRYLLYFVLVFIALRLYPQYIKLFIRVGLIGAAIVLIFAFLQVFVLPYDVLKYIGYGQDTIAPYMTVDQNYDFIRINSTLRGPNPLGAYTVILLAIIAAVIAKRKYISDWKNKYAKLIIFSMIVLSLIALYFSYSRSAYLGSMISVGIVLLIAYSKNIPKKIWVGCCLGLLLLTGLVLLMQNTYFVSNILLHENPAGVAGSNSNDGHLVSLQQGTLQMVNQPFGDGIGSAGSASIIGGEPEIIENQYLLIAHETGWLGLIIFLSIYITILLKLWVARHDYLALGVFASGVGLAVIGLLLPVWADDTVSIIWWGLAAIAIASSNSQKTY